MSRRLVLFLVVTVLCFAGTGFSQPHIGVKLGAGVSDPVVTYGANALVARQKSKTGAVGELFVRVPVSKNWHVQPGLRWVVKGYESLVRYNFGGATDAYYTNSDNHAYVEMPLLLLYTSRPHHGLLLGAGPVPALLLHPTYSTAKKSDIGLQALVGYQWKLGFSFQLEYTHGLANADRDWPANDFTTSLKNRFTSLTVGYLF